MSASRNKYTLADFDNAARFLLRFPAAERGNKKHHLVLAETHPEHTWQSWHTRYRTTQDIQIRMKQIEAERRQSRRSNSRTEEAVVDTEDEEDDPSGQWKKTKTPFTAQDDFLIVSAIARNERNNERKSQIWIELTEKNPDHTICSWQSRYANFKDFYDPWIDRFVKEGKPARNLLKDLLNDRVEREAAVGAYRSTPTISGSQTSQLSRSNSIDERNRNDRGKGKARAQQLQTDSENEEDDLPHPRRSSGGASTSRQSISRDVAPTRRTSVAASAPDSSDIPRAQQPQPREPVLDLVSPEPESRSPAIARVAGTPSRFSASAPSVGPDATFNPLAALEQALVDELACAELEDRERSEVWPVLAAKNQFMSSEGWKAYFLANKIRLLRLVADQVQAHAEDAPPAAVTTASASTPSRITIQVTAEATRESVNAPHRSATTPADSSANEQVTAVISEPTSASVAPTRAVLQDPTPSEAVELENPIHTDKPISASPSPTRGQSAPRATARPADLSPTASPEPGPGSVVQAPPTGDGITEKVDVIEDIESVEKIVSDQETVGQTPLGVAETTTTTVVSSRISDLVVADGSPPTPGATPPRADTGKQDVEMADGEAAFGEVSEADETQEALATVEGNQEMDHVIQLKDVDDQRMDQELQAAVTAQRRSVSINPPSSPRRSKRAASKSTTASSFKAPTEPALVDSVVIKPHPFVALFAPLIEWQEHRQTQWFDIAAQQQRDAINQQVEQEGLADPQLKKKIESASKQIVEKSQKKRQTEEKARVEREAKEMFAAEMAAAKEEQRRKAAEEEESKKQAKKRAEEKERARLEEKAKESARLIEVAKENYRKNEKEKERLKLLEEEKQRVEVERRQQQAELEAAQEMATRLAEVEKRKAIEEEAAERRHAARASSPLVLRSSPAPPPMSLRRSPSVTTSHLGSSARKRPRASLEQIDGSRAGTPLRSETEGQDDSAQANKRLRSNPVRGASVSSRATPAPSFPTSQLMASNSSALKKEPRSTAAAKSNFHVEVVTKGTSTKDQKRAPSPTPVVANNLEMKARFRECAEKWNLKQRKVCDLYFAISAPWDFTGLDDACRWFATTPLKKDDPSPSISSDEAHPHRPAKGSEEYQRIEQWLKRSMWTYDEDCLVLDGNQEAVQRLDQLRGKNAARARRRFLNEFGVTDVKDLDRRWPFN